MDYKLITLCLFCSCLVVNAANDRCDPNCRSNNCRVAGQCDGKCKSGYMLNQATRKCDAVKSCSSDSNCIRCMPSSDNCHLCKDGYKLSSTLQCVQKTTAEAACDRFCTSGCTANGNGKCDTSCQLGFVLRSNVCEYCDPNCDLSSGCETRGPRKCDALCTDGYTLSSTDNTCKQCHLRCVSGCDVQGALKCDSECEVGYALNTDHVCIPCDANCDPTVGCKVNGPSSCDGKCTENFILDTTGSAPVCLECDKNCASGCTVAGEGRCDGACKPGYAKFGTTKTCRPCASNCAGGCTVQGPFKCDGPCAPGFFYNNTTGVMACYPCDKHCDPDSGCSSAGTCLSTCLPGYTLIDSHCN